MRKTREIKVGRVSVGGGASVSVQTMANVNPRDAAAIVEQARSCAERGCDIFRITVPDAAAAEVLREVKKSIEMPIVADIHLDYRAALASIEGGADALRINPGNIGSRDRVQAVARAAKAKGIPIRVGVNAGSLEKDLRDDLTRPLPERLAESALRHLKMLEDEGFHDVVLSAKVSSVMETIQTYRILAEKTDCPLHLGVTEAGTLIPGTVRNSVALGVLLSEGIGDTIRVSLTAKPEKEVRTALEILRSLNLRPSGPAITSCPTCGRTKVDLVKVATRIEDALEVLYRDPARPSPFPNVAVMGCAVNGPGEAKGADIALCGGDGDFVLYVKGESICRVSEEDAVGKVVEYALRLQ